MSSSSADIEMTDGEIASRTVVAAAEEGIAIRVKAQLRMEAKPYAIWIDKGVEFNYDPVLSSQLKALKNAEALEIDFQQMDGEGSKLYACDVGELEDFFDIGQTDHDLAVERIEQAFHGIAHLIDQFIDDRVKLDLDVFCFD